MELTISLLFFAIASAVCIQLFVKSHNINKECEALSDEHIIASNIAENYRAGELESIIPNLKDDEGTYVDGDYKLVYGNDMNVTSAASGGVYEASLTLNKGMLDITVSSVEDPDTVYTLNVYRYFPGEVTQ